MSDEPDFYEEDENDNDNGNLNNSIEENFQAEISEIKKEKNLEMEIAHLK